MADEEKKPAENPFKDLDEAEHAVFDSAVRLTDSLKAAGVVVLGRAINLDHAAGDDTITITADESERERVPASWEGYRVIFATPTVRQ